MKVISFNSNFSQQNESSNQEMLFCEAMVAYHLHRYLKSYVTTFYNQLDQNSRNRDDKESVPHLMSTITFLFGYFLGLSP